MSSYKVTLRDSTVIQMGDSSNDGEYVMTRIEGFMTFSKKPNGLRELIATDLIARIEITFL